MLSASILYVLLMASQKSADSNQRRQAQAGMGFILPVLALKQMSMHLAANLPYL